MKKILLAVILLFTISFSFAQSPIYTSAGYGANYSTDGAYLGWNISGGGGETNFVNNIGGGNIGGFTFDNTTRSNVVTHLMNILGNGNVGIGTTNPTDLLTLNAGANRKGITIASDGNAAAYADLTLAINSIGAVATGQPVAWEISHRKDGYFTGTLNGNSSLEFYANLQGGGYYAPLSFKPDGNVVLVSNRNALGGNVLIGKTSQTNTSYKLDVNGNARANEIVVNTTGADFVFNNHYNLPELSEVKSYIDQNHHLPEIPSAEQMQKDGLSVGEMNTKLLQKVEELTLYLIEKDKELNIQRDKVIKEESELRSQNEELDLLKLQLKQQANHINKIEKELQNYTSHKN